MSLSACGSSNDSGGDEASGSTYQQVQESGTLTVGTEGTYRPFSYHEGNELTGYDVEVIEPSARSWGSRSNSRKPSGMASSRAWMQSALTSSPIR